MRPPLALIAITMIACGGASPRQPLYRAGTDKDEGHGMLARASSRLLTGEEVEPDLATAHARRKTAKLDGRPGGGAAYGGDSYGMYGGGGYGGAAYAGYTPPTWGYPTVTRGVRYTQKSGLTGAIEGVVSWHGNPPPTLTTACGSILSLRVGPDHAVAGILVYVEHVSVGRAMAPDAGERRTATVGGVVVKRGCALAPTVQVVTPLPAALSINGDGTPTRVKITAPAPAVTSKPFELQEGGRIELQARPGITYIESDDGTLGAAWVVGLETPYYAITDDTGHFRIDELAAGSYEVSFWQPPLAALAAGKLAYGAPVLVHRSITVDAVKPARLDVALGH